MARGGAKSHFSLTESCFHQSARRRRFDFALREHVRAQGKGHKSADYSFIWTGCSGKFQCNLGHSFNVFPPTTEEVVDCANQQQLSKNC